MTDKEFDILDELYFVKSFSQLQNAYSGSLELEVFLREMFKKGWIRVFYPSPDDEISDIESLTNDEVLKAYFNISKKGLFAHNTQ